MRYLACVALYVLAAGCGDMTKERLIEPAPKTLQVGESVAFALDPGQSSDILRSGDLQLKVVSITATETTIEAKAKLETLLGPQKVNITQALENEILSTAFLASLRSGTPYRAKHLTVTHTGMTELGCDSLRLSDIDGQPNATIEPTVCAASRTIPLIVVRIGEIRAVFKQAN